MRCRWDGGDCCASTTEHRIVRRFPESCKEECDCKDPDAAENKGGGANDDEDDQGDDGEKLEGSGKSSDLLKTRT